MVDSVVAYFRSCGSFSGRESRAEYWRVMRIVLAIPMVLVVFGIVISSIQGGITGGSFGLSSLFGGIVLVIPVSVFFVLVLSSAWLSVTARRLHDTGRSARWLLVYAGIVFGWVAVAGIAAWVISELASQTSGDGYDVYAGLEWVLLILFVAGLWGVASLIRMIILSLLCASVGVAGPNRYGPNPLQGGPVLQVAGDSDPSHHDAGTPVSSSFAGPHPAQVFCTRCGEQLQRDAGFCTYCGNAV